MIMQHNVGRTDRFARITLGSLLLAAGSGRMAREGTLSGLGYAVAGGMMLAEGILGSCMYYSILGIDTREELTNETIQPYEGI